MAYTINRTNGTLFATVQDGTINTDSSLIMIGKNYAGYGEALNENFFKLLENHANSTAPSAPQPGQLWYDSSEGVIKLWNDNEWKDLGASAVGVTGPTNPIAGDLWFDTVNSQLNVYDGSTYVLIGPSYSAGTGTTGSIVETVTDGSIDYVIIKVVVNDAVVAIISKHVEFTPIPLIAGFTSIKPGYNLSTNVDGQTPVFSGDATNALLLNNIPSTDFLSSVGNDSTSGTLAIENDGGLDIGVDGDMELSVSGTAAILNNTNATGDIRIQSAGTSVITVDGTSARARVGTPLAGTDIANMDYVDTATVASANSANALESATTTVDVSASAAPAVGQVLRATSPSTATWQTIIDLVYPVGAIYASAVNTSPATLFGGTWTSIQGRTLFAEDGTSNYTAGDTGGSKNAVVVSHTHPDTFSIAAVGDHNHSIGTRSDGSGSGGNTSISAQVNTATASFNTSADGAHTHTLNGSVSSAGESGTNANMPPYLAVYMWQRTA